VISVGNGTECFGLRGTDGLDRAVLGKLGISCWQMGRNEAEAEAEALAGSFGIVSEGIVRFLEAMDEVLRFDIPFQGCNYSYFGDFGDSSWVIGMLVVDRC